jgi:uncharacterized spore protein YtfJ
MNVEEVIAKAQDAITVKRVFGEPYEKDGVTIIPAAKIGGGGGGGGGEGPQGGGSGSGFGFGGQPVGAYVVKDGVVRWQPALDLTGIIVRAQTIVIVALLVFRAVARAGAGRRSRRRRSR